MLHGVDDGDAAAAVVVEGFRSSFQWAASARAGADGAGEDSVVAAEASVVLAAVVVFPAVAGDRTGEQSN